MEAYQVRLQWSAVHLRYEDFNRKARGNDHSQSNSSEDGEWNLKELSRHPFLCWEYTSDFASALITNFLLREELPSLGAHGGDAFSLPPAAKVNLLTFPIFHENDTPERVNNCVNDGERPE